jgi:endonuclease/exonuclease/phosphatase family metal-dependent hydrolase
MLRRCAFSAVLVCFLAGWLVAADRADTVRIMTQNMDGGTDHGYVIAAAFGMLGPMTVREAVDLTFSGIQASNLEQRATLLAQKIALKAPDIVALQEATLWQADLPSGSVTYDQLALLLAALKRIGSPYEILAVNQVNDLTLPGSQLLALREVERDALLVRAGAAPPAIHFSDVHTRIYAASFSFITPVATFHVASGWISATVHTANRHFVLAATHLQSNMPGVPQATDVQVAQAQELLHDLRNTVVPVVICGDFNSDANGTPGVPDASPTAQLIQLAGYADSWNLVNAGDPGNTWPAYLEDQFPIAFPAWTPLERIDLLFSRGMEVVAAVQVMAPSGAEPPFASDHAGLLVALRP